ncbi:lactose permease [Phaffia rhodozyma]|uniref:Lactose permease n=1 Tax=Phaffia rhodozyma TaxID=264483 RepID=A0A0F7SHM7_PHARH|nr:lactose permease [Phaffia rhodozyma]
MSMNQRPVYTLESKTGSEEVKQEISHEEYSSDQQEPQLDFGTFKDAKVVEVFNAQFAAAMKAERINPRSRESFMLYFVCAVCFLCACTNGYDGSLMTAIQAMPYYKSQFNLATTGSSTGLVFSIYTIGSMVGAFTAGPISDRFGRRVGMFCGGLVICIGMAVVSSAHQMGQLIAGRFILGWGVSIMTVAAPAMCVEVAPPQWRGRMVGIYNCGWFGGSVPAAAITFGTNNIASNMSWRLPLIFQGAPCFIVMICVFFIPESPRWLMQNGRNEEALAFLVKYHGGNNRDSKLVELEWKEFQENIALDASDKRWWDYRPLIVTSNGRWRMMCVLLISVFGQFSGNGLGYFNTVIYNNLGYTSPSIQLGLNLSNQVVSAFCAVTAACLSDRMPRRPVLIYGTFGAACLLAINGSLSYKWAQQPTDAEGNVIDPNLPIGQGALAAYFLFNALFSFTYTPLQGAYPAECLESTARAKGMALSGVIVSAIGFINMFCGPIALGNIKNNYVFVFVGWDVVETIIWYFCCVETQGRTLEELDWIFSQKNPVKASKKRDKIAISHDKVVVVDEA